MLDPVTQQYYLRARFYNPVIGRFTQEDTYYGDGLNLYQYCQANPVGYVDPSGHSVCPVLKSKYEEYRKQHPEANAAKAYEAVTGKDPLKKNDSKGDTNYRYTDSQGNVYDSAKDYLIGPARTVNGDPLMYSMNNRNGGTVVLSTAPIDGKSFINTLHYYNSQGKNVVILSGTHGSATGKSGLGANRLFFKKSENAFCAERNFFYEDVDTVNGYDGVKVYDITKMSDSKFKKVLNSKAVIICAWCYSERSNDIINAVR